jgi:hypothetical protein
MKRRYSSAIKKIARQHGVSEAEVYTEMQQAISFGYNNPDPEIQAYWRRIAPDGSVPTPERVIEVLSREVKKQSKY